MADGRPKLFAVVALVICFIGSSNGAQQYLGKFLGKLSELHHGVSGEVYAVDARTLHLKDFTYDGEGPAAYFWAGSTRTPGSAGFRVRDENGNPAVLKRYRRKSITITLPDGKTLNNIKWFSVWCEEFAVNFGDVKIPRNFDYPKPQKINGLQGVHGVSSDNIVIVDAQTLLIPNFSYDGEAPDAKFWVGRGTKPGPQGYRVPDENGKEVPLRRYDRKTVVLTLPGDLTVFDIGHFGVWCEAFTVDFGHVRIPQQLNVPPSLKMLGVSPQKRARAIPLPGETDQNVLVPSATPQTLIGGQLEATTYRPHLQFIQQQQLQQQPIQQQLQPIQQQLQPIQQQLQPIQQQLQPIQQHQIYLAQHRQDNNGFFYNQQQPTPIYIQQQDLINQQRGLIIPQQQYNIAQQQQLQYYSPIQQQQILSQQFAQRRHDQNLYNQQQQQQPVYNQQQQLNQHQINEQVAYNQLLQQRRLIEEQQLRQQLSKSHNRFDISPHHYG